MTGNILQWLKVNEQKREISIDGRTLSLTRKEYDLLVCLYKKAGNICLKDNLIAAVWPEVIDPGGVSDAAIDQLIHRLRNKIEDDPSHPEHIISKKGFGYMLV